MKEPTSAPALSIAKRIKLDSNLSNSNAPEIALAAAIAAEKSSIAEVSVLVAEIPAAKVRLIVALGARLVCWRVRMGRWN